MNNNHLEGESMKVGFDGGIKLEFHGAKVTSDGGLLASRDLDDALGLFDSVSANFHDNRTGCNIQHALPTLLRQSIYSRLAGHEDVPPRGTPSVYQLILSCERLPGKMAKTSKPPVPTR